MKLYDLIKTSQLKCKELRLNHNVVLFILQDILRVDHTYLLSHNDEIINEKDYHKFVAIFSKYCNQEAPIQYLLGYTYFYGLKISVDKNVLIPRNETEELVELALKEIKNHNYHSVLDLCTGSGCMGIALKVKSNIENVYASDISLKALKIAKRNAIDNHAQIHFLHGDLLKPCIDQDIKLDLIVCNPPYISIKSKDIDSLVYNHEPHLALFAKDDGLYFYKKILKNAAKVFHNKGMILFEIGFDQSEVLTKYISDHYGYSTSIIKDINQHQRILKIKINV